MCSGWGGRRGMGLSSHNLPHLCRVFVVVPRCSDGGNLPNRGGRLQYECIMRVCAWVKEDAFVRAFVRIRACIRACVCPPVSPPACLSDRPSVRLPVYLRVVYSCRWMWMWMDVWRRGSPDCWWATARCAPAASRGSRGCKEAERRIGLPRLRRVGPHRPKKT